MIDGPIDLVIDALKLSGCKPRRSGTGWSALCPNHEDRTPSMSIGTGSDGRALVYCHVGCSTESILSALGLKPSDLFVRDDSHNGPRPTNGRAVQRSVTTYESAEEVIVSLERQLGKRAAWWAYHGADGTPVGCVIRWNQERGKTIRPVSRQPDGSWVCQAMKSPRPLYRLPDVTNAESVVICEGEPAAEAIRDLGLCVTTSSGGCKAASKTDWSPLAGKHVTILPDNDDAGRSYADDASEILLGLDPPAIVRIVTLPGLPPHGDAVQYIESCRRRKWSDDTIRAELQRMIDATEPESPAIRGPIEEALSWRPFPTDMLFEPVRSFVEQGAAAIGCDPSMVTVMLAPTLASAVGTAAVVRVKPGYVEPVILWGVTVSESGTRKTAAHRYVTQFTRERQTDAMRQYDDALQSYNAETLTYERALTEWRRSKSIGEAPAAPVEPVRRRFMVGDTTIEALAPILQSNPRGVLLAADELSSWFASFSRYKSGAASSDATRWTPLYEGDALVVDRKGGGSIYVKRAGVSICGAVQPEVLKRAVGSEHQSNGLLPRFLLACPPDRVPKWSNATVPDRTIRRTRDLFNALYSLQPTVGDDGEARPVELGLAPEAMAAFVRFHDELGVAMQDAFGALRSTLSKLRGGAVRLAGVLHLCRIAAGDTGADRGHVDVASMNSGIELAAWFAHEARRLHARWHETDEDREQAALIGWIRARGGKVSIRDLTHGPRRYRGRKAEAERALRELAGSGYGTISLVRPPSGHGRESVTFTARRRGPGPNVTAGAIVIGHIGAGATGATCGSAPAPDPRSDAPAPTPEPNAEPSLVDLNVEAQLAAADDARETDGRLFDTNDPTDWARR